MLLNAPLKAGQECHRLKVRSANVLTEHEASANALTHAVAIELSCFGPASFRMNDLGCWHPQVSDGLLPLTLVLWAEEWRRSASSYILRLSSLFTIRLT